MPSCQFINKSINQFIMRHIFIPLILTCLFYSCSPTQNGQEIHQNRRSNIINIHNKIEEIAIEDVLISRYSQPFILNECILIADYTSIDKVVHIFHKNNFKYLCSIGSLGMGPNEITSFNKLVINSKDREFYISDSGKQKLFAYQLDSVLLKPEQYRQIEKVNFKNEKFPQKIIYINDTLSYASVIKPTGNSGFNQSVEKWNIKTGDFYPLNYTHPLIEKVRNNFDVSVKDSICVECYDHHDLISILDLDGNLKYNIYGPKWQHEKTNKVRFYSSISIAKGRIFVTTSFGRNNFDEKTYLPTAFLIFDLKGNYLKTIETDYNIIEFCVDEENNRIILSLDDNIQYGYFSLEDIL